MCGICGIINFDKNQVSESAIRRMMFKMKHRGPDDEGTFIENNIGLGFVRLSILDLSAAGHQPMISDDKRYVLVFNGEIYNYIELRDELICLGFTFHSRTDTEVLMASYIMWGEKCLSKFNGMWAFVIYDRLEKKIFAARDRFGVKPFYYYVHPNGFAFASEIPPLISIMDRKPEPDYQSVFDYLVFNRTDQAENTFFSDIKKLQHGHCISIDLKSSLVLHTSSIFRWYNLRERVLETEGFEEPEEFQKMLKSSIGIRLRSDVPIGVCLSGGLDSSSIVSTLLRDFEKEDLKTFSIVFGKDQSVDETEFIDEYKNSITEMFFTTPDSVSLKKDLLEFVKAHGEPVPSASPYAQYKLMNLAKGKVVVTLDGQGADEELAGYHYFFGFFFKDLLRTGRIDRLGKEIFYYLRRHKSFYGIKSFLYFLLPEPLRAERRVKERKYINRNFSRSFTKTNSISGTIYNSKSLKDSLLDHFEYKLEHLLKWSDRNSMWFSLESRVPFLDFQLVEKTLATAGDKKIKKGMTKSLLREAMTGILPEKIRLRQDKIGFETPQDEWFRTPEWRRLIEELLSSKSFRERNLINSTVAQKMYVKHLNREKNFGKEIWKWVHLEMWFREFID